MGLRLVPFPVPERGALFVVSGASGTGKTTLVKRAVADVPGLRYSVSATTRAPRSGEVDGREYHFLDGTEFQRRVDAGEFLEWAEVYGKRYGTLAAPVRAALAEGASILLEIDTQGAAQVRARMPDAVTIFVLPPSPEALETRLRQRSTDPEDVIQRRLREAHEQLVEAGGFDYVVVNDNLDAATDQFESILTAELLRTSRHPSLVARFR
jgi:guanylate kinase